MEWYEGQSFWAHIVILGLIIFLSLMFNLVYKRKTNPLFVVETQVILPLILAALMQLVFFNWPLILIDLLSVLVLYGIFNYSYFWYNQHRKFDDEKSVELNFDGQEPDRDPYCRVYFPKFEVSGATAYSHFEKHVDVIKRYAQEGFMQLVIEDFYMNLHPEWANVLTDESRPKYAEETPPDEKEARQKWEIAQLNQSKQIEDWEKAHFLEIMTYILEGLYLHIIYFRWQWAITPKGMESSDLHSDVKVYLLSVLSKLPPTLVINAICYYRDESEDDKTWTCLLGFEGKRSESLLKRMTIFEANLDIFRLFPTFNVVERLERRVRYYEIKDQQTVTDFEELAKKKLIYDTRVQNQMPPPELSLLERIKKRAEGEY